MEWSPDETKIVYIAEKKVQKSEPFYKQKSKASPQKDSVNNDIVPVYLMLIVQLSKIFICNFNDEYAG